jgi:hypothetical protein
MEVNLSAIRSYLINLGFDENSDLTLEDDFYVSPFIDYNLKSKEKSNGTFLLQLKYNYKISLFQITFWGRDFFEEWLENEKLINTSLLTNRINNGINIGSFWLDLDSGTLAFNCGMIIGNNSLDPTLIKFNIDLMSATLETYYPTIKDYIFSQGTEDDFNNAIGKIS